MVTIHISEQLAKRLTEIAKDERQSVDEIAASILEQYISLTQTDVGQPRPGSGGALLRAALAADIHTGEQEVASRSREILDNEFAVHLKQRLNEIAKSDGDSE